MIVRTHFFPHVAQTGALGFGTPSFMPMNPTERERVFAKLLDAGVTHFDTAPYYGFGVAEGILGSLSQGCRERLTITTKFGIQPPRLLKSGLLNRAARRVLRTVPRLRRALARGAQAATTTGAFTPADAKRSLDASLKALRTSYIDLLLLHEPTPSDAARDDLLRFLHDQVAAGTILGFGCGGNFADVGRIAATPASQHSYLQYEDSAANPNLDLMPEATKSITFGSITTLPQQLAERVQQSSASLKRWNGVLDLDCSLPSSWGKLLVAAALQRNQRGLVLFASSKQHHLDASLSGVQLLSERASVVERFWQLARTELATRDRTDANEVSS